MLFSGFGITSTLITKTTGQYKQPNRSLSATLSLGSFSSKLFFFSTQTIPFHDLYEIYDNLGLNYEIPFGNF